MKLKRILSLLLVLATLLLTLTSCGLGDYLSDILNHPQIEFKDLSYDYIKLEDFEKLEKELDGVTVTFLPGRDPFQPLTFLSEVPEVLS